MAVNRRGSLPKYPKGYHSRTSVLKKLFSKLLPATVQGPWTFFTASWARDFVTMSARPAR